MSEEKSITVSRSIDASTTAIFEVLSNPDHHAALDGSGFVRSVQQADRITATGQVFTMNMEGPHMGGEYQTDNHVTGFDDGALLAWQSTPAGAQPYGWEWVWRLVSTGPDSTEVSLTYDWSKVTDKEILSKVTFPLLSADQLEDSLGNLASAVAA